MLMPSLGVCCVPKIGGLSEHNYLRDFIRVSSHLKIGGTITFSRFLLGLSLHPSYNIQISNAGSFSNPSTILVHLGAVKFEIQFLLHVKAPIFVFLRNQTTFFV